MRLFAVPCAHPVWGCAQSAGQFTARDRIFSFPMDFTWIVVGLAGWALALVFVLLLMRMAGHQDRAARHGEKRLHPFSDVTITKVQKDR